MAHNHSVKHPNKLQSSKKKAMCGSSPILKQSELHLNHIFFNVLLMTIFLAWITVHDRSWTWLSQITLWICEVYAIRIGYKQTSTGDVSPNRTDVFGEISWTELGWSVIELGEKMDDGELIRAANLFWRTKKGWLVSGANESWTTQQFSSSIDGCKLILRNKTLKYGCFKEKPTKFHSNFLNQLRIRNGAPFLERPFSDGWFDDGVPQGLDSWLLNQPPPLIYPPSNKGLKACLEPLGSSSIIKSACSEQGKLRAGELTSHNWCLFPLNIIFALSNFYWLIFENPTPPKKTSTIADLKTGPFHDHPHLSTHPFHDPKSIGPTPWSCRIYTCLAMAIVFWLYYALLYRCCAEHAVHAVFCSMI